MTSQSPLKSRRIYFADFETSGPQTYENIGSTHVNLIALSSKLQPDTNKSLHIRIFLSLDKFFEHLSKKKAGKTYQIFFHNLSRFDGEFLIKNWKEYAKYLRPITNIDLINKDMKIIEPEYKNQFVGCPYIIPLADKRLIYRLIMELNTGQRVVFKCSLALFGRINSIKKLGQGLTPKIAKLEEDYKEYDMTKEDFREKYNSNRY